MGIIRKVGNQASFLPSSLAFPRSSLTDSVGIRQAIKSSQNGQHLTGRREPKGRVPDNSRGKGIEEGGIGNTVIS